MKTRYFVLVGSIALSGAFAFAQNQGAPQASSQTGQTSQTETQNNTAGSIAGNAAQTNANPGAKPGTVNPNSQDPTTPTVDKTVPNTPQSGGSQSGQSSTLPQNSASPANTQVPPGSFGVTPSNELKSQLDSAFQSEPTLSGSSIQTNVTDTTVELSGTVPTGKEKITAKRIAQSYSGNRKVVDRLTVTGRGGSSPQPSPNSNTTQHNPGAASNSTPSVPTNPSQAPQGSKPLQNGDASSVPQR